LPFVLLVFVFLHIFYLHETGRTNPLGVASVYKVRFHYLYSVKDLLVYFVALFLFCFTTFSFGYSFIDAENWVPANTDTTPHHIQPEWYFLFAYAILRSIPNKVGGVVALVAAVAFLFLFSIRSRLFIFRGVMYDPVYRFLF
jgi:ubiquinol-cytochrome c reductase cytochrome b subunit